MILTGVLGREAGLSLKRTANLSSLILGKMCLEKASAQLFRKNLRSLSDMPKVLSSSEICWFRFATNAMKLDRLSHIM